MDYIGAVQGIPVCFDAKECGLDTFPLQNVHEHQMDFMRDFEAQDGVAFFLIYYTHRDECYYVPYRDMARFWKRAQEGGRKSFLFEEIDTDLRVTAEPGLPVPFLQPLQLDLDRREAGR